MWLHDSKAKINVFFVAAHIWKNLKNPLNLAFGFEANWSFSKLHFFPNFSPLWRRLPYLYVCFVIVTNGSLIHLMSLVMYYCNHYRNYLLCYTVVFIVALLMYVSNRSTTWNMTYYLLLFLVCLHFASCLVIGSIKWIFIMYIKVNANRWVI